MSKLILQAMTPRFEVLTPAQEPEQGWAWYARPGGKILGFRKCPVSVSVYASGSKGSLPNCWEYYLDTGTAGLTE